MRRRKGEKSKIKINRMWRSSSSNPVTTLALFSPPISL